MKRVRLGDNLVLCIIATIALTLTGCDMMSPNEPPAQTETDQALDKLKGLPSLEDTNSELTSIIEQIGKEMSAVVPSLTWQWQSRLQRIGCSQPYEQSGGELILTPHYVSNSPVPESNWKEALAIVKDAASSVDAHRLDVFQDAPNNHDVRFSNETGTAIGLASQSNTVISGYTGCRLSVNKK